jgi:sugar diacid utilization regulator
VVLERLAALVAVDARRTASSSAPTSAGSVDELTAEGLSPEAAVLLARRVGLPQTDGLVPIAARARAGIAAEALAALLARRAGQGAVVTTAGRTILVAATGAAAETITSAVDDPGVRGWDVRLALGHPGPAHHLAAGWVQAREALAFTSASTPTVVADDLGVLTLLSSIPGEQVLASPDVRAVERVATRAGGDQDLVLLARYCETGSLRETAASLHMHHSSVDYRVKKLERDLGIALDAPTGRMRALLAVRLWQVHRPTAAG